MKTVVFNSPFLDIGEFPDARVRLARNVPQQVTDEQAAILLTNPDVRLVSGAPAAPVSTYVPYQKPAPVEAVDAEENE